MEKIFVKYTSDRGLMCRINKELEKQITRKINSLIKKAGVWSWREFSLFYSFWQKTSLHNSFPLTPLLLYHFISPFLSLQIFSLVLGPHPCVQYLSFFLILYVIVSTNSNQTWIPLPPIWFIALLLYHRFIRFETNYLYFSNQ